MIFLLSLNFFFVMETSEQHTTTDLVNFVYSPNGTASGRKKPENIRASRGFKPVTSPIPVRCSTN